METKRINADNLSEAAELLREGELVAVPTETVYGLAGNGLDEAAVEKIYAVKGRPEVKPLSLMVSGTEAMEKCWESVPPAALALAERYWPGPLTIVMTAKESIPAVVRAGGSTVGLRCPAHPMTLELLRQTGFPLAAPSANPSGAKSPKTADEVSVYFSGNIGGIIDGGECSLGVESTIIDLSKTPYQILREGAVSMQDINSALSESLTIIGITGGTGCGKTTALNALEALGALVIDCDAVYHDITISDKDMKLELISRFGDIYNSDVLDRKALGNIVFGDKQALNALNEITHKYVNREVERRLTDWALSGGKYAAIDAIALIGTDMARRCRSVVGIIAPTEARVARLIAREGIDEGYARKRIEAQPSNDYFAENCDYVLSNDGTMEQFEDKCSALFSKLLEDN